MEASRLGFRFLPWRGQSDEVRTALAFMIPLLGFGGFARATQRSFLFQL
jgi:hypothetical protein